MLELEYVKLEKGRREGSFVFHYSERSRRGPVQLVINTPKNPDLELRHFVSLREKRDNCILYNYICPGEDLFEFGRQNAITLRGREYFYEFDVIHPYVQRDDLGRYPGPFFKRFAGGNPPPPLSYKGIPLCVDGWADSNFKICNLSLTEEYMKTLVERFSLSPEKILSCFVPKSFIPDLLNKTQKYPYESTMYGVREDGVHLYMHIYTLTPSELESGESVISGHPLLRQTALEWVEHFRTVPHTALENLARLLGVDFSITSKPSNCWMLGETRWGGHWE